MADAPMMEHVNVMDMVAALGWIGAALSLASYLLVSTGRLSARSLGYQGLMLVASAALAISCAANGAWPSFLTNSAFLLIGAVTIAALLVRPRARRRVLVDARRAVHATGRAMIQSTRTFVRRPRPRTTSAQSVLGSALGNRRHEIDELLESTQQAGLEVPVVANAA